MYRAPYNRKEIATFFWHRRQIGQGYRTNSVPRIPRYADIGFDVDFDSESQIPPSADVDVDSVSYLSFDVGIDVVVVMHLFLDYPFCDIHYYRNHHRSHRRNRRLIHRLVRRLLQEQADVQKTQPIRRFQLLHDFGKNLNPDPWYPLYRIRNPMPVSRTRSMPLIRR